MWFKAPRPAIHEFHVTFHASDHLSAQIINRTIESRIKHSRVIRTLRTPSWRGLFCDKVIFLSKDSNLACAKLEYRIKHLRIKHCLQRDEENKYTDKRTQKMDLGQLDCKGEVIEGDLIDWDADLAPFPSDCCGALYHSCSHVKPREGSSSPVQPREGSRSWV